MVALCNVRRAFAAALSICLATGAIAQSPAIADKNAEEVARILGEFSNLPQLVSQQPDLTVAAGSAGDALELERVRLAGLLRDRGYLNAEVEVVRPEEADGTKVQVRVSHGPSYVIGSARVTAQPAVGGYLEKELDAAAEMALGKRADSASRYELVDRVLWTLGREGYPFPRLEAVSFRDSGDGRTAELLVRLEPGPIARFTGADLSSVDSPLLDDVNQNMPFAVGDIYSVEGLHSFREALREKLGVAATRVDVMPDGPDGFSLAVRATSAPARFPDTWLSALGLAMLTACLLLLALRQAAVSGGLTSLPVRVLSIASGALLLSSGCLLAVRASALI